MIAADREFRERSEKPVLHLHPRSGSGLGRRRSDSGDRVVTVGIYPLVSNVLNTFGVPAACEGIMS